MGGVDEFLEKRGGGVRDREPARLRAVTGSTHAIHRLGFWRRLNG